MTLQHYVFFSRGNNQIWIRLKFTMCGNDVLKRIQNYYTIRIIKNLEQTVICTRFKDCVFVC